VKIHPTDLPEVLLVEPTVFGDDRGFFFEAYNEARWVQETGDRLDFVQDNHSRSAKGVLRGLHYQLPEPQGKLVRVTLGAVWDVAVDLRRSSPTFTRWVAVELSEDNKWSLWIPPGFGHGFVALSDVADVLYKATSLYNADYDRTLRWDDPRLGIDWPLDGISPILSAKDAAAPGLGDAVLFD
jgi:dTDP-4-dehydrorhamnose 3,5-epimerase